MLINIAFNVKKKVLKTQKKIELSVFFNAKRCFCADCKQSYTKQSAVGVYLPSFKAW